jgi:hypothetical protein
MILMWRWRAHLAVVIKSTPFVARIDIWGTTLGRKGVVRLFRWPEIVGEVSIGQVNIRI